MDKEISVQCFHKAYASLQNMLEGKDSLDYEKAVFITENAYHNNYFKYDDFKQLLDKHTGIIIAFADNIRERYKEKYNSLRDFEQRMFNPNINNYAIFKYITDTAFVIINNEKYYKTPYNYTAFDPYGSDNWENTQVLSLLLSNEKQGNCYSLAVLFKLFADRLQSDARLTITPHHIYIQNRNQRGGFCNIELASKTFPGDGSIQTLTYSTTTAVKNGMAQRMLSDKEAIALNLIFLAKAYQHKYKDNTNEFLLQCADFAFKYDTLSMNALLLKAEITENRLLAAMQANKISTLSKARVNLQTQKLLASYEQQLSDLYTLGYREIPKEIERVILAKIQNREEGSILKDYTPNPFAYIKAKTRYKTLSNGLFDEMHEDVDSIQYNHALLNTKTKKIIKLLPIQENDEYKVDPVVFALSVDPLSDKYPNISPYAYCAWNPVILVDPDGRKIKPLGEASNMVIESKADKYRQALLIPRPNEGIYETDAFFLNKSEFTDYLKNEKYGFNKEEINEAWDFYQVLNSSDIFEVMITNTAGVQNSVLGNDDINKGSTITNKQMETSNNQYGLFYNLLEGRSELSTDLANAVYNEKTVYNPATKSNTTINADSRGKNWAFFGNKNYDPTGHQNVRGVVLVDGTKMNFEKTFKTITDAVNSNSN